jgi:hypothetical protein
VEDQSAIGEMACLQQQSERWLDYLATRTRKPVKPATIAGWGQALNGWLNPHIGNKLLSDVSNKVLRELVGKMVAAKLSPKNHRQLYAGVGIGLGLAEADLQLVGRSLLAEIVGALFVMAAGLSIEGE